MPYPLGIVIQPVIYMTGMSVCVTTSSWTYGLSAQEERYGENEAAPAFLYLFVL